MHEHDEERTVIQHANGFPMIKTTMFERGHDRYVFPSQCEHVFYSNVPGLLLIYKKKMILKIKKMIQQNIRQSRKIMDGRKMKKTKKIMI